MFILYTDMLYKKNRCGDSNIRLKRDFRNDFGLQGVALHATTVGQKLE